MIEQILLLTGLTLIAYGIYKWVTINNDYFEKRGIVHLKPSFLLGNTANLFLRKNNMYEFSTNLYNSFPSEKIFGFFDGRDPIFYIRDINLIKQLSVKDFDYFEDHKSFLDENADDLFSNSLFLMRGQKWRHMRSNLSPAFTGSKIRQMFDLVTECSEDMSNYLKKQALKGDKINIEARNLFSKHTTDIIASTAFGIKINSVENENNEFYENSKKFTFTSIKSAIKIVFLRAMPSVMKLLKIEFIDADIANFLKPMVLDTMNIREKEHIYRPDMINILMQVKKGNCQHIDESVEEKGSEGFATAQESHIGKTTAAKQEWTDNEIAAQCFLFFLAGFDTTSTFLSFATYELAINADVQEKLYAEILETNAQLSGKSLPYDILQKMKYLDMFVSEILRKWTPAPITDRLCVKDYNYNDGELKFSIKKGRSFWIPIYPLHHDPNYFPNPDKFDPERFSDNNRDNIVSGSFNPFGVGPRNCIGSRFALMEVKAILYHVLLNFKIEPNEQTQIPIKLLKSPIGISFEKGVHVHLQLR